MRCTNRDDFSRKTQIQIMQKSGYRCSYPGCEKVLIGPSKDLKKPVYVGIVAHICAASPRGPRYDPRMTHEERFGEENGILLCREHAALIDIDDSPYPAELLRQWKLMAYKRLQESLAELTTDPTNHRSWSAVRELVRICLCTCQTQGTIVKGARFRSYSGILYQLLFEDLPQEPDYDKQTELWMSAIHKIASDALEPVHCRVSRHDRSFPRHYRYIMEELKTYSFQPQQFKVKTMDMIEATVRELFQSEEVFGLKENNKKEIF